VSAKMLGAMRPGPFFPSSPKAENSSIAHGSEDRRVEGQGVKSGNVLQRLAHRVPATI
jgi:hypothetical protein